MSAQNQTKPEDIARDVYGVERDEASGVLHICTSAALLASRAEVEALLAACQSHLRITDKSLALTNRAWRKEFARHDCELEELHQQERKQTRTGYVYLMRNERTRFVKIGYSRNPRVRESTLQSEEPEVIIFASWPGTRETERELHQQFNNQRVRGEWFKLDEADISLIEGRMTGTGGF